MNNSISLSMEELPARRDLVVVAKALTELTNWPKF